MFQLIAVCLIKLDNFSVDIRLSANVSVDSSLSEKWMDSVSVDSSLLHLGQLVNISVDNSSSEAR